MKKDKDIYAYDGSFNYQGRKISYKIIDNSNKPIENEKMSRYINFCENGNNLGVKGIYGYVEDMTNISSIDARKWFDEYLKGK